ncbi:MAG: hypothetical protein HQK88_10090 [Nitrospirae bacterium]|nr:hypothetical protein [Nitrospirota bacterium]MBF0534521.1 hypothetical protein [Nitrospirota bacterium]MBF0617147.1 hypothetical protein [Nitrospirota bacterium]
MISNQKSMAVPDNDLKFVYMFTLAFFILTLFNIFHHEMWRDELEAWVMARDAGSLHELFKNIRYQGHPMLWHLILFPITKITRNPVAMQMAHIVIATASAFIFLRFAPFNKLLRGLFIFGYFPFFEYAVISRDYALGILFLFLFIVYFLKDSKHRNYILLSAVLFLMCQCNAMSMVLAIALAITAYFEPILLKNFTLYKSWQFYTSILIFAAGLAVSIILTKPPSDSYWYHPVIFASNIPEKIADQISEIWNVFVPVPRFEMVFWLTNFLSYLPVEKEMRYMIRLIISLGLLLFTFCIVFRRKIPALFYISSVLGVTSFCYIFFEGSLRHKGHYYFAFVAAVWISKYYQAEEFINPFLNNFFIFFERNRDRLLTLIFSAGVIAALTANTLDYIYQFSESRETANYIKQNNWQNMPVSGFWDFAATGVMAYLDRPFYSPVTDRTGTFTVWKAQHRTESVDVLKATEKYMNSVKSDVLLVFNSPVKNYEIQQYGLIPLKQFTKSVVKSEKFYLYVMRYYENPAPKINNSTN